MLHLHFRRQELNGPCCKWPSSYRDLAARCLNCVEHFFATRPPHATCCHVFHARPNILGDSWGTVLSHSAADEVKEKMKLNGLS